ncbi:PKD domain-containing protein [Chengkuizengella axinellae]|uniref:microbial collagenase n=1 Tax=Chengkuizengella axinellae TaxID=3064388 RepID=A0ABT9IXJ4_9BACL|nr:PKD domain-containing protein [Chengkuizengella sp. 2205SS18-9]MDP5273958.1 collagenase [Chengkuizengella sp. 2205SS18-9]
MNFFMNNLFGKIVISLLIMCLMFPSSYISLAQQSNDIKQGQERGDTVAHIQRMSKSLQNERSIHVKDNSGFKWYEPARPQSHQGSVKEKEVNKLQPVSISNNHEYSFRDLAGLSYVDLVNVLETITIDEITDFFNYSQDIVDFYRDEQRLRYLINEIEYRGSRYTANDDMGLETLIRVLNEGFYYGFDYEDPDLAYLEDVSFRGEMTPAILSIMDNPNFELGTTTQETVIIELGYMLGHAETDIAMFDAFLPLIREFNDQVNTYIEDNSKADAVVTVMRGLQYNLYYTFRYTPYNSIDEAPWYGRIDSFFNEIAYMLNFDQFANTEHEWVIDNALYVIKERGIYHSNSNFTIDTLNDALSSYPYYGLLYLSIAEGINELGGSINYDVIVADYEDYLYGNHYSFDDGTFIIKAGDRVPQEKIKRLYWASKEEKAQFHRLYGIDEPAELGNPDDVLTAIIYNDQDEYRMNYYLNGVSTDNGGIYIESIGTFYTWDREVPRDSSYELEELFRHEYFHFLHSRFVVPGFWGRTDMYDNSRMVWVDEGGGEFLAGATRTGIDVRASMADNFPSNPAEWYTLDQVLHGTYGAWELYDYSFAFYDYMYKYRMDIFDNINEYLFNEDAAGFDRYMDELSNDRNLEAEYYDHIQRLINDGGRDVLVEDDYLLNHSERSLATISDDITREINLSNVFERTYTSDLVNTYTVEGTYVGSRSFGEEDDREDMNVIVNQVLASLDTQWSGYRTVTAYFVNHSVNSSGNYVYDVVFHGMLTGDGTGNSNDRPTAFAESSTSTADVGETVSFYGDRSSDSDGTIASYEWNFDDGSISTRENPTHSFSSAGNYNITLTVTDNDGSTDTDTITITVLGDGGTPPSDTETEPNNRRSDADVITGSISGTLDDAAGDWSDWFTFEVTSSGSVTISVTGNDANFSIVVEDENRNVVAYPLRDSIANLAAGTYYAEIYTWAGYPPVDYTISVSGGGGGSTNNAPVALAESSTATAEIGEQVTFFGDGSSDSDGTITSYAWNFDDGDTSTSQNTRHTFTAAGNYNVSLTVTDDQGATNTDTITITVGSATPPSDGVILEESGILNSTNTGVDYYFTAVGNGTTTITLTAGSADDAITWQLYETAMGTRVGWATQNGNVHEYTMDLVPGTEYELSVYTWENLTINYGVVVTE